MTDNTVLKAMGIDRYKVEKIYTSKKNNVFLASAVVDGFNRKFVVKKFADIKAKEKECYMLNMLHVKGVQVPRIFGGDDDTIVMEHINGDTLLDEILMLEGENANIEYAVSSLSEYLKLFYDAAKTRDGYVILKDVNLRNFILSDTIYGIDFEECGFGLPEEDIGRLCGYFITYRPEFSKWKLDMVNILFNVLCRDLSIDRGQVKLEFINELKSIEQRRSIIIPEVIFRAVYNL